jgi:hypothetical protein
VGSNRPGPQPWAGCDTAGDQWKAYCEAWEHVFKRKPANAMYLIADRRGKPAVADLEHNISVVKRDYAGEIDRADIPRLLKA